MGLTNIAPPPPPPELPATGPHNHLAGFTALALTLVALGALLVVAAGWSQPSRRRSSAR